MLVSLDEVGLQPPRRARSRCGGARAATSGSSRTCLSEAADGWALALTSLRDLYGSRVAPEEAGGDFAGEAGSLGTMTARMHLAADKAFGRRNGAVADWAAHVECVRRAAQSRPPGGLRARRDDEGACGPAPAAPRWCGPTATSTSAGWPEPTRAGWWPTGARAGSTSDGARPSTAPRSTDVADLLWSLRHVAHGRPRRARPGRCGRASGRPARAWTARNRRAFLSGYLSTPGIEDARARPTASLLDALVAAFELERGGGHGGPAAGRLTRSGRPAARGTLTSDARRDPDRRRATARA